jgi:hypothetical protein
VAIPEEQAAIERMRALRAEGLRVSHVAVGNTLKAGVTLPVGRRIASVRINIAAYSGPAGPESRTRDKWRVEPYRHRAEPAAIGIGRD